MQAAAMLKTNKTPTDADIDGIMNVRVAAPTAYPHCNQTRRRNVIAPVTSLRTFAPDQAERNRVLDGTDWSSSWLRRTVCRLTCSFTPTSGHYPRSGTRAETLSPSRRSDM